MAQPVWTLSVDLQTKTATFQTGMADAARAARSSFSEIKDGASEMGRETGYSMTEARHGVMLLGEEFGVHLPRALTSFLASLGPIGAAMEAAFPFLAILVGATLLLEHLSKLKAEGNKLSDSQVNFGTTVANVLNGLNDKLLEAGIKADELNHNHLGALNKQLQLIDHQSMNELVRAFDTVAKSADLTFAQLKTSWYQFGAGSAGAKNALDQFKTQYDSLLAQGKDKEASDLLSGTRQSAEKILQLQQQAKDSQARPDQGHQGNYVKFEEAKLALQKQGIGFTDKEIEAQRTLVDALQAQVNVQDKVAALKAAQSNNAVQGTQNKISDDADKVAREQAQAAKVALDEAEKLREDSYRRAVSALQESEREKIDATEKGSAERLAAIEASIKEENAKGLQETGFFKSLLQERVNEARQMDDEEKKIKAEAGKEDAEQTLRMGQLVLAAKREQSALLLSGQRVMAQQRMSEDLRFAEEDYRLKMNAFSQEIQALEKHGKDYENKLKAIQDKQTALTREHENQVTEIKNRAEEERNTRILSAENHLNDELARGMTQLLMRHQTFAKTMVSLGDQIVSGMITNALKSIMANDMTKESDAAAAARKAYLAGMHFPFPVNIVMGPTLAAMAFASVMAFASGGIVPGVESGDVVPARLEPGEAVIPKQMTEKLSKATDGDSNGGDVHVHHHATYHVQALDSTGVDRVLEKHGDKFTQHAVRTLRKMNK